MTEHAKTLRDIAHVSMFRVEKEAALAGADAIERLEGMDEVAENYLKACADITELRQRLAALEAAVEWMFEHASKGNKSAAQGLLDAHRAAGGGR